MSLHALAWHGIPEAIWSFMEGPGCISQEYSKFSVAPGANVNGQLTLGENTADNGGARIALLALENTLANRTRPVLVRALRLPRTLSGRARCDTRPKAALTLLGP